MAMAALLMAPVSGAVWFVMVAMAMSDLPLRQAMRPHVIELVWSHTQFGRLWQLRSIFWITTAVTEAISWVAAKASMRRAMIWPKIIFAAALLGSLAWSGHGRDGERAQWHLLADAGHLIVAAAWPTGLLPFGMLIYALRGSAEGARQGLLVKITRRFSTMSLISVALLAASGIVNSCYLLESVSSLVRTPYGRTLLVKIILFLLMVALGAINLLWLKPRLDKSDSTTAGKLQWTVGAEFILGIAVVIVVAILGTLPPG